METDGLLFERAHGYCDNDRAIGQRGELRNWGLSINELATNSNIASATEGLAEGQLELRRSPSSVLSLFCTQDISHLDVLGNKWPLVLALRSRPHDGTFFKCVACRFSEGQSSGSIKAPMSLGPRILPLQSHGLNAARCWQLFSPTG